MTNSELSKAIRADLKKAGYTSKDYKIRVRYAGYETEVRIWIKNPAVRKSDIEKIVMKYREVEHDLRSYEILAGGNTFVFVEYEYGVLEEAASELLPTAENVLANPEKYSGRKIADNGKKHVHITQYNDTEWTLAEFDNEKDAGGVYEYRPTYWIRSALALAIAMYRFKIVGTIYA